MLKKDQAKIIYPEQIKARNFEIPACGGCQITGPAENLDEYFETDSEVVIYESMNDLVDKIRYYLSHDIKRTEITEAGYKRTHKDHTYEERFNEIFRIINL
jgi:spore maturation protein CgeB